MKIRVFIKGLVIAALLAACPALAQATTPWPGVSFSFDDGYQSLNIARPLFKQYNVVGVSFPIVDYIGTPGMATWSDLSALLADGWEIGSHTMTHPHLSLLSDLQLDYELGMSKQILESTLDTPIYALSLPYGDGADNPRVLSAAAKYYHFVRNVQWDYNSLPPSPYHLVVQEPYSFTTTSTIIQWIETARSQGKWLILVFHNVVYGTPNPSDEYSYGTDQLTQILEYVRSHDYPTPTFTGVFKQFPPVANAGPNQTVPLGTQVNLDGSGSSDPCAQTPLAFAWSFASKPAGSNATLSGADTVNPSFILDVAGSYVVQSVVTNSLGVASQPATVTISSTGTPGNSPPVANAGPNQTVHQGATVILDGSLSFDPDGDPITFAWDFTAKPPGSSATLSNPTSVNPTFTADKIGNYVVQLIVTDSHGVPSAPASVTISTQNSAPVANAGPPQTVPRGTIVTLDGSGSYDPEGDAISYAWSFTSKPAGSTAVLNNSAFVHPTFTADVNGNYVVQLIVTDSWGAVSSPATVTISVPNFPPVANAGPNQTVTLGANVTLDGSASYDPDGDPITYAWSFTSKPAGSNAILNNFTTAHPSFTVDLDGTYVVQLIVTDSHDAASAPVSVTVSTSAQGGIIDSYSETNWDDYGAVGPNMWGVGQAFAGNGASVTAAKFYVRKSGTPTGSAYAKIYAMTGTFGSSAKPTGAALAISAPVDVSTIPTSWGLVEFTFASPFQTTSGSHYVVTFEYTSSDSNYIAVAADKTSPSHPGNLSYNWNGTWSVLAAYDICFYVMGTP